MIVGLLLAIGALFACNGLDNENTVPQMSSSQTFNLAFKAISGDQDAVCGATLTGYGEDKKQSISIRDIRFYVNNLKFYDIKGKELPVELTVNEFQYQDIEQGYATTLIDLTGNSIGSCTASIGTERTNNHVTGVVSEGVIHAVSFDISMGLPRMNALRTPEPPNTQQSPFTEMQWSWVFGMIDMLIDYSAINEDGIGSRGFLNLGPVWMENFYPSVHLDNFSPSTNTITLDLKALLKDAEILGTECHGGTSGICGTVYTNMGVDYSDTAAITHDASKNTVFSFQ